MGLFKDTYTCFCWRCRSILKYTIAVLFFLFWSFYNYAQGDNSHVLNVSTGLCDNEVTGLAADEWGFLWVATKNGLSRYDGQNCRNFYRSTSSLPSNEVFDIAKKKSHHLVLATAKGIVTLNTRTEQMQIWQIKDTTALFTFKNNFDRVLVLPDGWVAAYSKYGFYVFDSTMHLVDKLEADFTVKDIGLKRIYFVLRMDAFPNGDVLLSTIKGYHIYHAETGLFCTLKDCRHAHYHSLWKMLAPHSASYIYDINKEGQLFFLDNKSNASDSLYIFDGNTGSTSVFKLPFNPRFEIRWDGRFRFHENGLITINRSLRGFYEFSLNISTNNWIQKPKLKSEASQVSSIIYATSTTEVLGTAAGIVFNVKEKSALHYIPVPQMKSGIDASVINSAVRLRDRIYFTAFGVSGNVISMDAKTGKEVIVYPIVHDKFRALVQDMIRWNEDTLLLGTQAGLMLLAVQSGKVIPFNEVYVLPATMAGSVYTIWYDGDSDLWVSLNRSNGLWRYNCKTGEAVNFMNGLKKNQVALRHVENIVKDKYGDIWLHHYVDGITRFNTSENAFDTVVRTIEPVANQQLQIAGIAAAEKEGLWLYVNGFGLYSLQPANGSIQQEMTLFDRVENHNNPLAISDDGVLCINLKNNLILYDTRKKSVSSISNPQKNLFLQNNLKRPYFDEVSKQLVLAYSNLLVLWDFKHSVTDAIPKKIFITSVETTADSLKHNRFDYLKLKSNQNDLRIYFGSPDFTDFVPSQFEFSLKSSEGKEEWFRIGAQSFIQFNNLSPGTYTFSVRRVAAIPLQQEMLDSFQFSIASPFYAMWWFRLAVIAAAVLLFYMFYRIRIRQLLKIQAVRASISADLHDDIGSRHTNAQLLTALARREAVGSKGVLKYLDQIESEIGVSSESLNEIVWNMKIGDENLDSIVARMRKYAGEQLENDEIEYRFRSETVFRNRVMTMGKRRDIFLIFKEALTNIRKHAKASFVEIDISVKDNQFYMKLSDNGVGFEANVATDRNGLLNIRQRTSRQKGRLSVYSSPGSGTSIVVFIPFDKVSPLRRISGFIYKN